MPAHITRRAALSLLGTTAASILSSAASANSPQCPGIAAPPKLAPPMKGRALGDLARAKGLMLGIQGGIAVHPEAYGPAIYDPAYFQLLLSEKPSFLAFGNQFIFSTVIPDAPKGDVMTMTNSAYNITNTWYLVNDFAPKLQAAGIGAKADALIWDDPQVRQPWLRPIPRGSSPDRRKNPDLDWNLSRAEDYLRIAFDKIDELSAADPGFFKIVSLVNEPLDVWTVPGKIAYSGGVFAPPGVVIDEYPGVIGYIADLYRLAGRLRGPKGPNKPKLIINAAGTEQDEDGARVRRSVLTLLKRMLDAGLPLDGVGLEAHLQPQMMNDPFLPDWTAFGAFLDEVAALGLDIHVTELDVLDFETSCGGRPGRADESDTLVALYYESFLTRTLACKAVKSVTLWDLADRYSFYRDMDVNSWFGYDQLAKGQSPAEWPKCARMPLRPSAIACPRPNAYDDRYQPKLARAAIAHAFETAPARG